MSPELREAILEKRDEEAIRQRAGEEYIIGVIEANEPVLREIFVDSRTPEDEVPEVLFTHVSAAIKGLEHYYISSRPKFLKMMVGNVVNEPLVKLGWGQYNPLNYGFKEQPDKPIAHMFCISETAINIVNGYRETQGKTTLQEAREATQSMWHRAIEAAN